MGSLNRVMAIGRLCKDLKLKQVGESTVLNNSLAINEDYKNKQGEKVKKTEFLQIVLWNHPANIISKYCQKGSQIYIEGSLQTREWQDNEGNKRWTTEVNVRSVQLLDSKSDGARQQAHSGQAHGGQSNNNQQSNYQAPQTDNQQDDFIDDSDVPF